MGFIPIICQCGRQIGSVNENMSAHGSKVCPGCRRRVHYDYDKRMGHPTTSYEK